MHKSLIIFLSFFSLGMTKLPPVTATIKGRVVDQATGSAISGVQIKLISQSGQTKATSFTNNSGNYELKNVSVGLTGGQYRIDVSRIGYRPKSMSVYLWPTRTYTYNFMLTQAYIPDTIPPLTSVSGIPNNWSTKPIVITLSATDNKSGVKETFYSLDGREPSNKYIGPIQINNGIYTLKYFSRDNAGNKELTKTFPYQIRVDSLPPSISINPIKSPTNQSVNLVYNVDDNLTPHNEIIVTGNNSPYVNEGTYKVTLTAKDKAGNCSSTTINFVIDKTPPKITITSPLNGTVVSDSRVELKGTVDGTPFTEIHYLTKEGENVITKTVTDAAGNVSTASVTVNYYLGELIGVAGGEVISSDGKVKLIIPAGALSSPQPIRIVNLNPEILKDITPRGKSLLSVVECKPYGLVFNKPVQIIYTLSQAEIPGTQVELALYDAIQNKIISTGQTSVVPVNGYILTFNLLHFSTYAALKYLTPQGTPIGLGVKVPLPDMLTGAYSHAIPISIPPGRKGIQPSISLNYRSSNPNSWVGMGFSFNPGFIVRSTRLGPPTYNDTQDTFYFVTDAGTTELVYLIDNLYQAKVESNFDKFFKESDDSWRMVAKDGSVLRFGQTPDAKETSTRGTFAWYVTRAIDTNGNYIEYSYTKDQGKTYLYRINYTGNEKVGVLPTNSVIFNLESRDDVSSSYISGSKIVTAKRLKEIQVKVNSELVWRYELAYDYSSDTNRSLLKSITQRACDDKTLPAQTFTYQKAK